MRKNPVKHAATSKLGKVFWRGTGVVIEGVRKVKRTQNFSQTQNYQRFRELQDRAARTRASYAQKALGPSRIKPVESIWGPRNYEMNPVYGSAKSLKQIALAKLGYNKQGLVLKKLLSLGPFPGSSRSKPKHIVISKDELQYIPAEWHKKVKKAWLK